MSDIFISYSRKDQAVAKELADALESEGWTVWWDPKLRAGEHFDDVIEKALNDAKCVIVLWSKLSVNSEYVKAEAAEALEQKKLVPLMIENVTPPFRFKRLHTPSLFEWDGSRDFSEFRRLVEDIGAIVGPAATEARWKVGEEQKRSRTQQEVPAQQTAEGRWSTEDTKRRANEENRRTYIASRFVDYVADEFERQQGVDLRKNPKSLEHLKRVVQKTTNELYSGQKKEVDFLFVYPTMGAPLLLRMAKLTRADLESLVNEKR